MSGTSLSWPSSLAGYTLYSGTWAGSADDGYTATPITLPTSFSTFGIPSTNLYIGTNGYFTLNQGSTHYGPSPILGPPATMGSNPGDLYLSPNASLLDGTTQNAYSITGTDGNNMFYAKILVNCASLGAQTTPYSWIANFYRDCKYQWLEVKPKTNVSGNAGPFNVTSPSTLSSQVWRSDLNGQNWVLMGYGTVTT
jgi:hypothetical protein